MKLSKQTIAILKWASTIQDDLMIERGNRIRTISSNKAILLDATIQETFPSECGLKCLDRVLDYIDDTTEISFDSQTHIELVNGRRRIRVPKIDRKLVLGAPKKNIDVIYEESVFLHSEDVFEVRRLKGDKTVIEFRASAKDENIQMDCFAPDDALIQTFELTIPKKASQQFKARIKASNLKLSEGSFQLEIARVGVAKFTWLNGSVILWVAIEAAHSHFSAVTPTITTAATLATNPPLTDSYVPTAPTTRLP